MVRCPKPAERHDLYSTSRQHQLRELTDIYFNPPLQRVGLQWAKFDAIEQQGYDHAVEVLAELSESALGIATAR